jgi:hypothetical protein
MNPTATPAVQSPSKGMPNVRRPGPAREPASSRARSKTDWQRYLERPETSRLLLRDLCRNLGLEDARSPSPRRSAR